MPYGLFDYIPDSPIHTMGLTPPDCRTVFVNCQLTPDHYCCMKGSGGVPRNIGPVWPPWGREDSPYPVAPVIPREAIPYPIAPVIPTPSGPSTPVISQPPTTPPMVTPPVIPFPLPKTPSPIIRRRVIPLPPRLPPPPPLPPAPPPRSSGNGVGVLYGCHSTIVNGRNVTICIDPPPPKK